MKVEIRNNQTNEIRVIDSDASVFMWEEGNYSCDCNRAQFFFNACDDDSVADDIPCSEGLFSVRMVGDDGIVIYDEFDELNHREMTAQDWPNFAWRTYDGQS